MTGRCALVVDDNDETRLLLASILRRRGFDVDTAADGMNALEKLRLRPYDVVLLDIRMPKNGGRLIDHLRETSPDVLKRILLVTAASQMDLNAVDRTDVFGLVRKPFDVEELVKTIDACATQTV